MKLGGDRHPRVRYASAELEKLLRAVRLADEEDLDLGMRVVELERRLDDAQRSAEDWRTLYQQLRVLVATMGTTEHFEVIDRAMMDWLGRR